MKASAIFLVIKLITNDGNLTGVAIPQDSIEACRASMKQAFLADDARNKIIYCIDKQLNEIVARQGEHDDHR